MLDQIRKLFGREYYPLNKIEIISKNLIANYQFLNSINKIAPVLKSNAYGHGIVQIAKILDPLKAIFFCVDSIFEAYQIHNAKVKTKILIMGYVDPKNLSVKKLPFSYAIWDLETAKTLNQYQPGCEVHLFVDTGMGREGIRLEKLTDFISQLKQLNLKVVGLMSHLANSDYKINSQDKLQLNNFQKALKICQKNRLKLKYIHLANSAGHLKKLAKFCNTSRTGIALFGLPPIANKKLKPALRFTTKIIQVKDIKKGDKVGYGGIFQAKKDTTIGILPVGYNDGVDRRLSNKGVVTVSGITCQIIGMISMNITAIDLSDVMYPKVGDEVVIYSEKPDDKNSIGNTAKLCQTVPYDILVNLVSTTRREVI